MAVKISRILHAGYIFDDGETSIIFDPIFENPFSRNCHAFPAVSFDLSALQRHRFAAIFISHYHDDHCSLESLVHLDRTTPIYIFCVHDEIISTLRELGFISVVPLEIDQQILVGQFCVTTRLALDEDVDSIFEVRAGDLKILNVVDSWIGPETLARLSASAPWDLVLWPFQTMREIEILAPSTAKPATGDLPEEWIEQLKLLQPRFVVPSSCQFKFEEWSWANAVFFPISYTGFAKQIFRSVRDVKVVRINPGETFELRLGRMAPAGRLPFVLPIGAQDVDYVYDSAARVQPTGEIAKKFSALTSEQDDIVRQFCEKGVVEKYRAAGPAPDRYWQRERLWKLSVFDHRGSARELFYRVSDDEMKAVAAADPDWLTEIPATKLFAALELGESLTSLYIRVKPPGNLEIDPLEDPLVRTLFSGRVGSYQDAQLKRLRNADRVVR